MDLNTLFVSIFLAIHFLLISSADKSELQVFLKNGGPHAFRVQLFCFDPKIDGLTHNLGEGVQSEGQKSTFIAFDDKTKCRDNKVFVQMEIYKIEQIVSELEQALSKKWKNVTKWKINKKGEWEEMDDQEKENEWKRYEDMRKMGEKWAERRKEKRKKQEEEKKEKEKREGEEKKEEKNMEEERKREEENRGEEGKKGRGNREEAEKREEDEKKEEGNMEEERKREKENRGEEEERREEKREEAEDKEEKNIEEDGKNKKENSEGDGRKDNENKEEDEKKGKYKREEMEEKKEERNREDEEKEAEIMRKEEEEQSKKSEKMTAMEQKLKGIEGASTDGNGEKCGKLYEMNMFHLYKINAIILDWNDGIDFKIRLQLPEEENGNPHGVLLYCHRKLEDKANPNGFARALVIFANAPTGFSAFGDQRDTVKELKMENMEELEHCEGQEVHMDVEIGERAAGGRSPSRRVNKILPLSKLEYYFGDGEMKIKL